MECEVLRSEIEIVTQNIAAMMLALPIAPIEEAPSDVLLLRTCIEITGAWQGRIELLVSAPLADRFRDILFRGYPYRLSQEQQHDALRELANVTAGNIKNALPTPTSLSMAWVQGEEAGSGEAAGELLLELDFLCEGEPYIVRVYRNEQDERDGTPLDVEGMEF